MQTKTDKNSKIKDNIKLAKFESFDSNPNLSEMKYRLDQYKIELEESIKSSLPMKHQEFKIKFFPA